MLFRGLEVGRVGHLTLAHSGVQLAFRLRRADAPLRSGDRVSIRPLGIFGDAAVIIVPGPGSAPPLGDSTTLAAVPPDTLAPAREAAAQAFVSAALERLLQRESVSPSSPGVSRSRP